LLLNAAMPATDQTSRDEQRSAAIRAAERAGNAARAEFLGRWLPKGGVGAELGVFQGRFSRALLASTEATRLHLIDPFYFFAPVWHWGEGNRSSVDALVAILQDFKPEIESSRVLVHVADDRAVLREMPDEYFDWVYVDTSHQYQHTCDELVLLESKVKSTGVISGDDWQPDPAHRHHGVCKAVGELLDTGRYELLAVDVESRQWAIRRARVDPNT
jgi:hypothetical protein